MKNTIIGAANKYGSCPGFPYKNKGDLGEGAMIAPSEYGYWVGLKVYVRKDDVEKYAMEIGKEIE